MAAKKVNKKLPQKRDELAELFNAMAPMLLKEIEA
jgi:uncharacterized protein (UPF0216 family)